MFESALRANSARLQRVYDAMPYSLQNMMTSTRGFFLVRNRYSGGSKNYLKELRSHESWSAEQISDYQLKRIQALLEYARRNVPFYEDYPDSPINNLEELRGYPVLTRETVQEQCRALRLSSCKRE